MGLDFVVVKDKVMQKGYAQLLGNLTLALDGSALEGRHGEHTRCLKGV